MTEFDFPDMHVFARIQGGRVAEMISSRDDPAKHFHADLVFVDITDIRPFPQEGWGYNGREFSEPAPLPPPAPVTTVSPLEFMSRMTAAEDAAIATAAQSNAQVLLFLLQMSAATVIDLNDPRTIGGVNALAAAGLLTAERAKEILVP